MAHLSLSQGFLVSVPKLAVSLQRASLLSPSFSHPPEHLVSLQPTIILALTYKTVMCWRQTGEHQDGGALAPLQLSSQAVPYMSNKEGHVAPIKGGGEASKEALGIKESSSHLRDHE